jgi:hypothetical protein
LKGESVNSIVAIEITDMRPREERDPTGRRAMEQQYVAPLQDEIEAEASAAPETAQVIGFVRPNRDESSKR